MRGTKEYACPRDMTPPLVNGKSFSAFDAHSVVVSDHVFYGLCTQRKMEKRTYPGIDDFTFDQEVFRVECYSQDGELLRGFLKGVHDRNRPHWEFGSVSGYLLRAEWVIAKDVLFGSDKYGFPGVQKGNNVLMRMVGDNSQMGKREVTYFFEPVITI